MELALRHLFLLALAVTASTAWPSDERLLEITRWNGDLVRSEGRSVRYFADHESDSQYPDLCRGAFSAHGMYGQRISVFPALDMVVAHKSARNKAHPTTGKAYWDLIRLIFKAYKGRKSDLE